MHAIGVHTFGGSVPMRRDTIFRIASVTKPVTAVAAMILMEEDKRWLPELANRRVRRAVESPLNDTVPANRPITVRDVLTFRLGIGAVMVFPHRRLGRSEHWRTALATDCLRRRRTSPQHRRTHLMNNTKAPAWP